MYIESFQYELLCYIFFFLFILGAFEGGKGKLVMCFSTNGERAGLTEIIIWMLAANNFC